jgi:rhamnogalacturonan endolyase
MNHPSRTIALVLLILAPHIAPAQRQMEALDRGLVAVKTSERAAFLSWRLLGTDPDETAFNVYRSIADAAPTKLNTAPIARVTWFADTNLLSNQTANYFVRPIVSGRELEAGRSFTIPSNAPVQPYLSVPLQTPNGYRPNDASVGDLDGDGQYEIVLHQSSRGRDNSQAGLTEPAVFQAYKLDGTLLWTINLGRNIREGAHYTQFMVYDLDGDGRAEFACKTADGTVDGRGKVIGDTEADWRGKEGRTLGKILDGPEYLTIFDGRTGAALATTNYVPGRGNVADWGDNYGNRVDRFLACVAYLDGKRPSLVMCRGYYTRTVLAAWDWRDGKLSQRWVFDSDDGTPGSRAYRGQGNHSVSVADVDGDGRDEIVYGAMVVDDNGTGLHTTGFGHGDALHVSDLDPTRPGLEIFDIQERFDDAGAHFRNAQTGEVYWKKPSVAAGRDGEGPGRGASFDIDPRYPGNECWVAGAGLRGLFSAKGELLSERPPRSCNFAVWWDGDLLRELLDRTRITKWDWTNSTETLLLEAEDCTSNNGTKATPTLSADLFGDWREEVVWPTRDGKELRIYTTTIPTEHRLTTLMHDPQYRLAVAWQNVAYNQPPHPGYFLGHGMKPPANASEGQGTKGGQR